MHHLKTLSVLVAFYFAASASAQNTAQPPAQGQGQGSVLSNQALQALSCQNARDAAVGGTSAANILLTNALTAASPFDASSGTAGAVQAAQQNLAPSQQALNRIQGAALQGQMPSIQDMQTALAGFSAAAQNVNAAIQLSSQPPPASLVAGQGANATAPVLAAAMAPVITNLGPTNKQLVVNLNTAGSQLTQSNVGNSALQLQEVQIAMRAMMNNCTGSALSTGNSTGTSTGSGSLTGSTGNSTGTSTGAGQMQPLGQTNGTSGQLPGSTNGASGTQGQTNGNPGQLAGNSGMRKEKRKIRLDFL